MLSVADVHVAYGKTPALMGPSLVVGAAISLDGEDLTRLPAHERARRGLGYVPQGRMIFADLTVEENLLIGADLNRANGRALLEEVLAEFPVLPARYRQRGDTLSGGEQQMLAIARALVGGPKVLLLDEPSEGIQPSIVQEIEVKIGSISRARGLAIVLVEQNIEFAAALARRIYVMEKGRIAREISPGNVMDEDIVRDYLAV